MSSTFFAFSRRSTVLAGFSNVPVERVDDIEPTFYKVIREILETGQEELLSRIRVISKWTEFILKKNQCYNY